MKKQTSDDLASPDFSEHANRPGFLIRRLNQIAIALFLQRMAGLAVTPLQSTIMRCVFENPGLTQKAIATKVVLDASTTHDIILRLEAKGFLSRARSKTDRRARTISLTKAGQQVFRAVEPVVQATQEELVACLTPAERKTLSRLLMKLMKYHLERHGADGPPGPWSRLIGSRSTEP